MDVTNTMPRYISASQVSLFMTRPMEYRKRYITKDSTDTGSVYTAYGHAFHKALELNFKQKIESRKDLPVELVIQEFLTNLEAEFATLGEIPFQDQKQINLMPIHGASSLELYMKTVAPTIQPIAVEQRFEIELAKFPLTIVGYFDIIDENALIIDTKTAGKDYEKKWSQKEADLSVQGTLYSVGHRKLYGKRESGIRFDVMPRLDKPVIHQVNTVRSQQQILGLLDIATKMKKIIELDLFVPSWEEYREMVLG